MQQANKTQDGLETCIHCAVVLLEQRVHVQQVVLNGCTSDSPTGSGPQLTDSHGGLHFWVFDAVGFIQNYAGPGHSQERSWAWTLKKNNGKCVCKLFHFAESDVSNTALILVRNHENSIFLFSAAASIFSVNTEGFGSGRICSIYHIVLICVGFIGLFFLDRDLLGH